MNLASVRNSPATTTMSSASQPRRVNTFDVYVGNLSADTDQRKIGKLFSAYGEVHNIWINSSSDGNKYGLVKFYCEEDGLKAIEETNGMIFEGGKPILVKKAVKRGGALLRKDGDPDGSQEKEEGKLPMSVKQRNPDIGESAVPMFEPSVGLQNKRDMENVLISCVETPIIMWGQKLSIENVNELANIVEQLATVCPEAPRVTGKPENDKIYGAQYSEDSCWYRCVVRYTFHPERVKVQYIDFGNTEELNPSNLVELPKSLTALPPCAMKFVLHSLWCNNNQDPSAIKFVKELVEGKEVDAYTTARLSDHTGFFADIYIDGVCVNEKMLENNYAFKKPGLEQRGLKGRGQITEGDTNSNNFKVGQLNQRDNPRKFETEKDEINNLRWKLKNLQSEYASLSNKAQENDLSAQIKNLQLLSSLVRKLRNQFPIDKDTPLDVAIALVQSPCKIDVSMAGSLPEVINAINACKSAQDEILKCSDSAILKEKIETRDRLRRELHDKLNTTIQELNQVPLQDRGKQVQEVVAALTKHYDTFTKIPIHSLPTIDSLMPTFEEWKLKKKEEVVEARRISDMMESMVNGAFVQLKSQISISSDSVEEETSDDLDSTLKNYAKALQQEVAVSDTENSPDALIIGSLVQALLRELSEECVCVDHLSKVYHEFSALKEEIAPWLNSKPTTNELQAVKSKLKTLKSKLRHKLADKMDAEENQDTTEMEEIAKDLEDIRGKIHKALKEEDRLMSELSQLASVHFPELLSSESDTGFSTYLTYKGLVKQSYAPDHYTMTSVGNSSSGMFLSHFDGEPVIIREYFLSNGNHSDKDEFLSRMALYTNASSSNLEPISAVFFDKNNRHAYVQVKKQGELLSSLESSVLTKQQCQTLVRSIARALQALNLFNFIHGQVQPEFILVEEDGNAKLLPPDFSLTDADRCRSRYTTSSGVDIMAPEMKQNMILVEPGHSVDIYCLGLLALWLHYPTTHFFERKEGTLDFSTIPMDRKLGIFLMKLLSPNAVLRPTAEFCLRSEYLSQPVVVDLRPVEGQPPLFSTAYGSSQDQSGRNSASPASVLSQNSNDGLVYAESGAGVQMIANTRVPPPPLAGDNHPGHNQINSANISFSSALPSNQQQMGPIITSSLQQFQQQQQYQVQHQYMQQQMQQQQQSHMYEGTVNTHIAASDNSGSFEIGTFDPNAYEVVTSPQPSNAARHEDQDDGTDGSFQDMNGPGHDQGAASDDDAVNVDNFEDSVDVENEDEKDCKEDN